MGSGVGVMVGLGVGVKVGVSVGVSVGVIVAVAVMVTDDVMVGVNVGVAVAPSTGVVVAVGVSGVTLVGGPTIICPFCGVTGISSMLLLVSWTEEKARSLAPSFTPLTISDASSPDPVTGGVGGS